MTVRVFTISCNSSIFYTSFFLESGKMYSTKSIHKNINPNYAQTYTSIGDPYKSNLEALPGRWKKKQFVTQKRPQNAHDGYFYKLIYQNEPYTEIAEEYRKTQPLEKRKLGFGSHDAWKSGEFTSTKATERYRDVVKKEAKHFDKHKSNENTQELFKRLEKRRDPPKDKFGNDLKEPKFLYDIGRTLVTPYTPNSTHDSFYRLPKHAAVNPKLKGKDPIRRLGTMTTMSSAIGEKAWSHKYCKPEYGTVSCVEKFYDKGHIECQGF